MPTIYYGSLDEKIYNMTEEDLLSLEQLEVDSAARVYKFADTGKYKYIVVDSTLAEPQSFTDPTTTYQNVPVFVDMNRVGDINITLNNGVIKTFKVWVSTWENDGHNVIEVK